MLTSIVFSLNCSPCQKTDSWSLIMIELRETKKWTTICTEPLWDQITVIRQMRQWFPISKHILLKGTRRFMSKSFLISSTSRSPNGVTRSGHVHKSNFEINYLNAFQYETCSEKRERLWQNGWQDVNPYFDRDHLLPPKDWQMYS